MTLSVAIVDDQALMRTGFQMILEAEPDLSVCWTAANGREALEHCSRESPDVVLNLLVFAAVTCYNILIVTT